MTDTKTPAARMQAKLESLGLPYHRIQCYGAQIMIHTDGEASAKRWARVLHRFCTTVRGPTQTIQEAQVNRHTMLKPSTVTRWRVWATV